MEESVALDTSKQQQFVKSVKGIKKLIKNKDKHDAAKAKQEGVKEGKVFKKKKAKRGLVYLSHIPHGFYEHQMTEYFKQFGVVTNVRVIRSKHTGNSKGYAFVEFKEPAVADIVAETMNNYLMGKRLLKAQCVPAEKQRRFALRKHWNNQKNPGNDARLKMKNVQNAVKTEEETLKMAKKLLSNISRTKKRLSELGIDYDFFTPVDIPESLQNKNENINERVIPKVKVQNEITKNTKPKVQKSKQEIQKNIKLESTKKENNKKKLNNKNSDKLEVKRQNIKKPVNTKEIEMKKANTSKNHPKTNIDKKKEDKLGITIQKTKKSKSLLTKRKNK